jgi:putative ABC transport system permease protein
MPTWIRIIVSKLSALFVSRRLDEDFNQELEAHLSLLVDKFVREGMPPEEAIYAARRQFGGITQVKHERAEGRGVAQLERVFHDLVYASRIMRKSPAFTATAVLTLALGIGGNTAMFTVIRAVLLKPLAYRDPDRLVRLSLDQPSNDAKDVGFSQIRYEELRAAARSFSDIGAFFIAREDMTLSGDGDPESIKVARVSGNFLRVLGVQPAVGRGFLPDEDTPGGPTAVMISAELWRRRFGADPRIQGKAVTLNSTPFTIAGVLPAGFAFPMHGLDAWITRPSEYSGVPPSVWRSSGYLIGLARLKPRLSLDQARSELDVLARQYAMSHPNERMSTMRVALLREQLVLNVRPMLWMLFGAVGFVLLIACANVASLLLTRATSRSREFAVRAALGAPRGRMIGQLLTESLLLASAGGAIGVLLARWALVALMRGNALNLPRAEEMRLDPLVLVFTVGLSMLAGVLFGLFPSLNATRPDLVDALRASGDATRPPGRRGAFGMSARGLLVVTQVALSVVLLIGAALLLESFARLTGVDLGFHPANLLTMQIALPISRYDWRKQRAFFEELIQRVKALPGVGGVAVTRTLPLTARTTTPTAVAEQPPLVLKERPQSQMQTISPDYFQALGIALRRGRTFNDHDRPELRATPLIVNESFARLFWPAYPRGQDPVGQHVLIGNGTRGLEIVGIVADVHERALDTNAIPEVYLPLAGNAVSTAGLVIRTEGDPRRFVNSVRAQVLAIDRNQAISDVETMEGMIDKTLGQRRFTLILLGSFAGVALLLAVVGLYGVIAYSVAQRAREVAIRQALGARRMDIHRLITGEGLGLTLAGVVIGVCGAAALTRTMQSLLFHISPVDPAVFLAIASLFVVVAFAASYIPARQAARIDPMMALR